MDVWEALAFGNDSGGFLASEFFLSHLVPALAEFGDPFWVFLQRFVFGDGLVGSFEREVRGVIGEVEEEGFVTFFEGVVYIFEGDVGEVFGCIEIFVRLIGIFEGGVVVVAGNEKFAVLVNVAAVEDFPIAVDVGADDGRSIETAVLGKRVIGGISVRGCVPFAASESGVARFFEGFAKGDAVFVERAFVAGSPVGVDHESDAGLVLVETGEEAGARGTAARGVIHLREAKSVVGEVVETRRFDFAAVASEVGVAEIVSENDDDVGLGVGFGEEGQGEEKE